MMHTLNEVLLEQNEKSHAELLSNYQAILEENLNRWREFSMKKSNAIISASANNAQITRDQFLESCIQLIDERIKSSMVQEIYELTRISRQVAIMNLFAATLVLISTVLILVILS